MPQLAIRITIDYPNTKEVTVHLDRPMPPPDEYHSEVPAEVLSRVGRLGGGHAVHELAYLRHVASDLGARVEASASKRVERINIFAPAGHVRRARLAALNARSGRLAFHTLPASVADEFDLASVIYNRHRDGSTSPDGVAVRLHTSKAVAAAIELTSRTLEQV